jgi:hypothetical protein
MVMFFVFGAVVGYMFCLSSKYETIEYTQVTHDCQLDTIYIFHEVDSQEIAYGYLRSNGALGNNND